MRVALLSLEAWDDVWRRNQHLATALVRMGEITELTWISPPRGGLALRARTSSPFAGIRVVEPPLVVPRRFGGYAVLARWLRRVVRDADVVWVNDPVAAHGAVRPGSPAVYDVTDDWRSMPQSDASRRRTIAAEDSLATWARTVVCSQVLADRWRQRYGVTATLIPNGVDVEAIHSATKRPLDGSSPHIVYVGTLHTNRLDLDLITDLATSTPGTMHLVGPNYLDAADQDRLVQAGVRFHGSVPSSEVPSWLVSADVLICPHRVDEFTLSLDAIKAHEYLATDRPVVATRSCGFQNLDADGLAVVERPDFCGAVRSAATTTSYRRPASATWADRAAAFAIRLRDRPT